MLRLDHKLKLAPFFLALAAVVVTTACSSPPAVADERSVAQQDDRPDAGLKQEDASGVPGGKDAHSPGAQLPQGPRLVVQSPDNRIQYFSLDGTSAVLVADAPASLLPASFDRVPMTDGPMVYIRQWGGGFYVLDTPAGQLIPLDFVPSPAWPVAVRPVSEQVVPEGQPVSADWDVSLAWGEFSAAHSATAHLYLSAPDGSKRREALDETYDSSTPWSEYVPWRWSQDRRLFFTKQPVDGMGGFPPFVNATNLWVYSLQDGSSVELVSGTVTGGQKCLDALSPDDRLLAHHCDAGQITLLDLVTGETTAITLPSPAASDAHIGSVRFSLDGSRIAFAVMTGGFGLMEETRGYVAVSDGLTGGSRAIASSNPGEWFSVAAWLPDDRLALQSHYAGPDGWPAVWTVRTDGSGLAKLTDGTFLAKFDG